MITYDVLVNYFRLIFRVVPSHLFRMTFGLFFSPKKNYHFLERILELDDLFLSDPVLLSKSIIEICDGKNINSDIVIIGNYQNEGTSDTRQFKELYSLAYLCTTMRFGKVFEIGTFVGRMTRVLACNSAKDSTVFTLDLPQNMVPHQVGEFYHNTHEAERIAQLFGDSKTFDYSQWYDSIDFCWVDACHDYEHALSDTISAFKMVKEGGWIGWHDYRLSADWAGVTKAVREINRIIDGNILHVLGTTIVLLHVSKMDKCTIEALQ